MPSSDHLTVQIKFNRLPELAKAFPVAVDKIVQSTALKIEARAKTLAPVKTGALRNSIRAVNTGQGRAEVRVGVKYGAYVEYGTRHRTAKPYLTPAVRQEEGPFVDALKHLEGQIK